MSHIAVFDIGKTNKKLLIFDEKSLKVVWMKTLKIPEKSLETPETAKRVISFEEDVERMFEWMEETLKIACVNEEYVIHAVVMSTHMEATVAMMDSKKETQENL